MHAKFKQGLQTQATNFLNDNMNDLSHIWLHLHTSDIIQESKGEIHYHCDNGIWGETAKGRNDLELFHSSGKYKHYNQVNQTSINDQIL
jgi:hypothetical protein